MVVEMAMWCLMVVRRQVQLNLTVNASRVAFSVVVVVVVSF